MTHQTSNPWNPSSSDMFDSSSSDDEHFHSDGGSELISGGTFLHAKGITTSHTPCDTPEMNSLLERKVQDLKERVMSILLH
jgi:hypothetical protein